MVDPLKIQAIRLRRRLTQMQAAKTARLTQHRWSEYETGIRTIRRLDIAERVAGALGVQLSALLTHPVG